MKCWFHMNHMKDGESVHIWVVQCGSSSPLWLLSSLSGLIWTERGCGCNTHTQFQESIKTEILNHLVKNYSELITTWNGNSYDIKIIDTVKNWHNVATCKFIIIIDLYGPMSFSIGCCWSDSDLLPLSWTHLAVAKHLAQYVGLNQSAGEMQHLRQPEKPSSTSLEITRHYFVTWTFIFFMQISCITKRNSYTYSSEHMCKKVHCSMSHNGKKPEKTQIPISTRISNEWNIIKQ